jgi:hypothetical protein
VGSAFFNLNPKFADKADGDRLNPTMLPF